jgi:hypothetical protein
MKVVLRMESISCPTFNNLKTLSLGEWCISRGADFYLLIRLLQHTPNLEKLFLQLEMVSTYVLFSQCLYFNILLMILADGSSS